MRGIQEAGGINRMRMKIYGYLVNRIPEIQTAYHSVRDRKNTLSNRLCAWLALACMNLCWLVGIRGFLYRAQKEPDENRKLCTGSESERFFLEEPEILGKRLLPYDVISFDVFDTLLFRPVDRPEALFYEVGKRLEYLDFKRMRQNAEYQARQQRLKESGHGEVTLEEIYRVLEKETGIDARTGMKLEIEAELEFCRANPYLIRVYEYLKKSGKRLVALSDMYLPEDAIRRMLEKCGYTGLELCLVSGYERKSKAEGSLYEAARLRLGNPAAWFHIGDNPVSDDSNARKAGIKTMLYPNINETGKGWRAQDMSPVSGSVYRGIINGHLHNGLMKYEQAYEEGFLYGGILAVGYCQFIHDYAEGHKLDKILFLSRDGDILFQVYSRLYPEEKSRLAYVYWSRLAAVKMCAGHDRHDYFRRFVDHKVNQGYRMEQIFKTMELSGLLERLEEETSIRREECLTNRNSGALREFLESHWDEVLDTYRPQNLKGKEYYEKILKGCRRAAAVDVGWAGSGAIALNCLANREWGLQCDITGLLIGTNARANAEPDMSESMLAGGRLVSYGFSQSMNRDIWKRHNPANGDNVMMEKLFSSPMQSFRGFGFPEPERDEENGADSLLIQKGILDFCRLYQETGAEKITGHISGRDALAPFYMWVSSREKERDMDCQCALV